MYHGVVDRVPDPVLDPYSIDVGTFESHLRFFRRRCQVVPLRHLVDRVRRGEAVPAPWVAITLDDALRTQVVLAAEMLGAFGFPWSIAVPAGLVGTGRSIWSYEFRFLVLCCWPWAALPSPREAEGSYATGSLAERQRTAQQVTQVLFQHISDHQRSEYLESLIDRAGRQKFLDRLAGDGHYALAGWDDLRRLREAGVEMVAHGWRHRPQNGTLGEKAFQEEIAWSKREMERQLGAAPAGFALPHGCRAPRTDGLLEESGYGYCLTSEPRRVLADGRPFHIPRFDAHYPLPVLRRHLLRR